MKYTFVGDIHGKVDCVEHALDKDGKIVFVGDFMDSFNKPLEDQKVCLDLVLDAIEKGKAEALLGNHELSYLQPAQHRCSGFSTITDIVMIHYRNRLFAKFKKFLWIDNFLITHAGLHPRVNELRGERDWDEWANDPESSAHQVGRSRGGWSKYGGIFWCDFNRDFEPIDGINQIFGHTRGDSIRTKHTEHSLNFCIDCLDSRMEFLELEI